MANGRLQDDLVQANAATIETAIAAVLNGEAEDDPFNRLIVSNALEARHAEWLRAWFRYLRQAGMGFGIATVVDALRRAPDATRALLALFCARHDPAHASDRATADMTSAAFRTSMLQTAAADAVRGRLQGVFTVVVVGGPRIADVVHGAAAVSVGTAVAAGGGGVLVVIGTVLAVVAFPAFVRYRVSQVVAQRTG